MVSEIEAPERERRRLERERRRAGSGDTTVWNRALAAACGTLALATLIGLVALWPGAAPSRGPGTALGGATVPAVVARVATVDCGGPVAQPCVQLHIRLRSGRAAAITLGPAGTVRAPKVGTHVRVRAAGGEYTFAGVDRRRALLVLALIFAVLVVAIARARGLLALAGLAISIALVTRFVLPALLAGEPGLLVALVGSLAVMFVTVVLTYGLSPPSLAACLGIGGSLLFAAAAGTVAVKATALDGGLGELTAYLAGSGRGISLQGLVLAGLVVGALGVLADTGVTQASAVMALRRANPDLRARALFHGAFTVGRDHLVATTHTLVLAYLGASLPLLLGLGAGGVSLTDALNSQDVAEPIVATLIGAISLLVSVPLTTALCTAVAHRMPVEALGGADAHGHAHAH
jgi:uncharacterized membrane protein